VKYFTQNGMNRAYKTHGPVPDVLARPPGDFTPRSIIMKTLITALAVTAILATSAVANPRGVVIDHTAI
jgi:hypothetical protein